MISISTTTADTSGNVVITDTSKAAFDDQSARVSRTATLDGGVAINHFGYSHGDRTFKLDAQVTETQADAFARVLRSYTQVLVAIPEGVFLGALDRMNVKNGRLTATILIKEKES